MEVRRLQDPAEFLSSARLLLLANEARHNLILGIAGVLRDHPGIYPDFDLWLVESGDDVLLAALRTPPYNLVLSQPREASALGVLATTLAHDGATFPGITAAVPEVESFAEEWSRLNGVRTRIRTAQRIYRVTRVLAVSGVDGRPRGATRADRPLLADWLTAFADEALPPDAPGRDAKSAIAARFDAGAGGFVLWEDDRGRPVSLAGWGGETPNGARIGPVYTPPEHRGHGYGSAVTAAVSAERLGAGRRFCFLYTDLANPTSNRIYSAIGYEPVCDSVDYAFHSTDQT